MKNKKSNFRYYSLKEYLLAMELRKKYGWGEKRIAAKMIEYGFNVNSRAVSGWIYRNKKPFNQRIVSQIPESSKRLTKEKAYTLGTLCGDGFITTGYRIGLDVCDEEFAEYFHMCLNQVYGLNPSLLRKEPRKTNYCDNPKPKYKVMLVSKLAVLDLNKYVCSFKTFEWQVPNQIKNASKEIQAMFIKGFADSEGSVKNRHRNRELYLFSGNSKGLKEIQQLLQNLSIGSSFTRRRDKVFSLRISDYKSLKIFFEQIGFVIKRKQEKLEAGLARYKRKGIRKYSLGIKKLALDMLENGHNYQEIGNMLNTSYANVHDWRKADKNPDYYKEKWQRWKNVDSKRKSQTVTTLSN